MRVKEINLTNDHTYTHICYSFIKVRLIVLSNAIT